MVMENLEMVLEKSWENMLSSLWEPCLFNSTEIITLREDCIRLERTVALNIIFLALFIKEGIVGYTP